MKMTDKEFRFLEEYAALCFRHGVYITGCGCCGSPFVSLLDGKEVQMRCTPEGDYVNFYDEEAKCAAPEATYVFRMEK